MSTEVLIMDYANIFCGSKDNDAAHSNHLTLTEVKLPAFDVQYSDHRAAGAPIYTEISTGIARLECTFVLVGVTMQTMGLIDSWISGNRDYFVYGNIRDQLSGAATQGAAYFRGQIGRCDPQNFRKGDVLHTNYSIRNIIHYEFGIGGQLTYYWDFFTNVRYVGGRNQNEDINRNLHVNSPAPEFRLNNFTLPVVGAPTGAAGG